ncbi:MAG: Bcr/CflA family efflux MFS transporter [Succinivibrionaceae bacterium]|nr:Bcr/CflA family efflux MFS transporter [Succinivibrionaceae bacterium]
MQKANFARVLAILCMICALGPLSTDMYLPSIPKIASDLATSVPTMQTTVSIFFLGMAFGQVIYGPLADAFGRRKIILVGSFIFFVASFAAIWADDFRLFFGLRLLQSLGASAGVVVINAIMRDMFDGLEFVRAVTVTMLTINIAPLVAPTLGGLIAPLGWRLVFVILSIYALCLMGVVRLGLKETLDESNRQSIRPIEILSNYRSILSSAKSFGVIFAQMANGAGMFAFIAGSPYVYMSLYGISESMYGLLFAANIVSIVVGTSFNTFLVRRSSPLKVMLGALIFSFAGSALLVVSAHARFESVFSIVIPVVMFICVVGIVGSNSTAYILGIYKDKAATASGAMGFLRFAGGALAGFALNSFETGDALPFAYTIFVCAFLALASFVLSRMYVRRARRLESACGADSDR